MNNLFVMLPDILIEKYGTKNSLAICLVLRNKLLDGNCILQFADLYEQLGYYRQHRGCKQIRQLFTKMQQDGLLYCNQNLSEVGNHKMLRITFFSEGKFTKIPYADIDKILQHQEKINLFAVYVVIKRHLFEENTSWTIPYEEIKKFSSIKSNQTIQKLLDILEQMGLITKTLDNTTKTNNNHQRLCYSFSVVSQKEKEKKSSFSNKETTTAKEGRVLVESNKNISPPTTPTTTQTTTPQQQTTTPTLQTTQEQQMTTRPKDISQKVWEAWMELPEVLQRGKSLEYCEEDGKYYVIQTLNGVKTRYLFAVQAVQDDKYNDDDDLPL